jgi:hypothetical protein
MSVLPRLPTLTYHRIVTGSLQSCDLQIFLCPTNENVTRVHRVAALEMETSGTPMTFDVALHHSKAFDVEVTLGAISHCVEGPPP